MKKSTKNIIVTVIVFFGVLGIGIALAFIFRPAAPPNINTVANFYASQKFLTNNSLTWKDPLLNETYNFRILVLPNTNWAYQWKPPSSNLYITVWDSANNYCGPNASNYQTMQSTIALQDPQNTRYNNANSITLGQTPVLIQQNGIPSIFRLQLYAGDLRIESTSGNGQFWSLFFNPGSKALTFWPNNLSNGYSQIMFQTSSGSILLNFVANGDLILRPINFTGSKGNWLASANKIPPTCINA